MDQFYGLFKLITLQFIAATLFVYKLLFLPEDRSQETEVFKELLNLFLPSSDFGLQSNIYSSNFMEY